MDPLVGIIMGSDSDLTVMQAASDILKQFDIAHEVTVVSAHRTPLRMRAIFKCFRIYNVWNYFVFVEFDNIYCG